MLSSKAVSYFDITSLICASALERFLSIWYGRREHFAGTKDHLTMFMHGTQRLHSACIVDELPA